MAQQLEVRVVEQVLDVLAPAGEEVVQADDVVALGQQPVAEMGADEPGAAGDEDPHRYFLRAGGLAGGAGGAAAALSPVGLVLLQRVEQLLGLRSRAPGRPG